MRNREMPGTDSGSAEKQKRCEEFKQNIEDTIRRLGEIQYFMMKKKEDWGSTGQDSVVIGYARYKYGLPSEAEFYHADLEKFEKELSQREDLADLTVEKLRELEDSLKSFQMGEEAIGIHQYQEINKALEKCGSPYRIASGMYGPYRSLILAEAETLPIKGFSVYVFHKERARMPSDALAVAALTGYRNIIIRRESCEYVFENKWRECPVSGSEIQGLEIALQRAVLKNGYGFESGEEVVDNKSLIVDEIVEFALYHELGHGHYFTTELEPEEAGKQNAFVHFGENIIHALQEPIADWAPETEDYSGPIRSLIKLSRNGEKEKARRMLLTYLSDNCFLDDSGNLTLLSEIDLAIICSFMKDDLDFDFEEMELKSDEIYKTLVEECRTVSEVLIEKAKNAEYQAPNGNILGFDFVTEQVDKFVTGPGPGSSDPQHRIVLYQTAFWQNVFLLMKRMTVDDYEETLEFLEKSESDFRAELLRMIDPPMADRFGGDLQEYIYYQLTKCGLEFARPGTE